MKVCVAAEQLKEMKIPRLLFVQTIDSMGRKSMRQYYFWQNDWGKFCLVEEQGAIVELSIPGDTLPSATAGAATPLIQEALRQLEEYFAGERREFNLPLAPQGTKFQQEVWQELTRIQYGETRSYQQCAENLGRPKACRAVGMACGCNPIAIIIPCHRVLAKSGALQGFRAGLEMKTKLLQLERKKD